MHIFIDESGLFVKTDAPNSFSAEVAFVISEDQMPLAEAALRRYKRRAGRMPHEEVKASLASDENYFSFLADLSRADGFAAGVVSDASLQGDISNHKRQQADTIDAYVPIMVYDAGKAMIEKAARDVRQLSDQNYVQMHCRAQLAWGAIRRGTLYYCQRTPKTLGAFRWAFDAKDIQQNHFESTMADLLGTLTQSHSLDEPLIRLRGADYSHFERFTSDAKDTSWFPAAKDADLVSINGKLFHENLAFLDSRACAGVQIADLIANGLTRCLKGRFADNDLAAAHLGKMMIREPGNVPSLEFVMFEHGDEKRVLDRDVARRVKIMDRFGKSMVVRE